MFGQEGWRERAAVVNLIVFPYICSRCHWGIGDGDPWNLRGLLRLFSFPRGVGRGKDRVWGGEKGGGKDWICSLINL